MGFSVSGAMAVILVGLFVAFAIAVPAGLDTLERMGDAQAVQQERLEELHNTAFTLSEATFYTANETVTLQAENVGTEPMMLNATHVLVDGELQTELDRSIDGETVSVWLPGETLDIELEAEVAPERIKLVTDRGLAETTEDVTVIDDG